MDHYSHRLQNLLGERNAWQEHNIPPPVPALLEDSLGQMRLSPESSATSSSFLQARYTTAKPARAGKKVTFKATGLNGGDRCDHDVSLLPWKLVKSYPHAFIGRANKARATKFFSAEALHRNQPWDLYYIYVPHRMPNPTPLILVPTYQFESHLKHINTELGTELCIPNGRDAKKFQVRFELAGAPAPRFLGRSTTAGSFDTLKKNVPAFSPADDPSGLTPQAREDYLALLFRIQNSAKDEKKKKTEKNRLRRHQEHLLWGKSLKRVQRYMGLRHKLSTGAILYSGSDTVPEDELPSTKLSDAQGPVGEPEDSTIFVSIDIEAYEFNQNLITEVGLAIFDTLDIQGQSPGSKGEKWFKLLQGHHLRIREYSWAENKVHVKGCADKFDFGKTAFVSKDIVSEAILGIIEKAASIGASKPRPVNLVFHDKSSDLGYLEKLRIKAEDITGLLEVIDTRDIYQHHARALNPTKLATVLADLQIPYRYLHNAGNDAVYTMQALIALAVQQRQKSRDRAAAAATRKTPLQAPKDDEGWNTGGEDSDGGCAGDPPTPVGTGPVMSWSSPESSPTKKTGNSGSRTSKRAAKEKYRHCVMDFDTSDEGVGTAV